MELLIGKNYSRVYCVFDKDQHPSYKNALSKIEGQRVKNKNPVSIYAITLVPCFECCLLLHFICSARSYERADDKSAGDQLISELKRYIPDYTKGHKSIFNLTKENLADAIANAKKIDSEQGKNGTDNPSTKMYQLVEYLQNIRIAPIAPFLQ